MAAEQLYNTIGLGYAEQRRGDRRVFEQVLDALGDAASVVNIGAGTGNYEPTDRRVVAVEPSPAMIAQRTNDNPIVQAFAEHLPLADDSFDAALSMLTIHHWGDRVAGLAEIARVARRQVSLIYDTDVTSRFWLLDYFPWLNTAPWEINAPDAAWVGRHLLVVDERVVMVPIDCTDGFSGAYWGRPEHYLRPEVQAGMSTLARLTEAERAEGTAALQDALDSGAWDQKYGHLRTQDWLDIGYRLVISERP